MAVTRNEKGQFVEGNKASPGRPKRPTEAEYLAALTSRVTLAKWGQIIDRALTDAIAGDYRARQWVSDYIVGKPVTTIDLRAGEQAQLAQVLDLLRANNIPASEVFGALITELVAGASVEGDDHERG